MSPGVAVRRRDIRSLSSPVERALASAAGAVSHADGVELLLAMPDAELGHFLKQRIGEFREMTAGFMANPLPLAGRTAKAGHATSGKSRRSAVARQASGGLSVLDELTLQAQASRRVLLEKRALVSSGELQQALGITRQAVSAATRHGRLFSVDVDGASWYPAFFADGRVDRSVLGQVSQQLGQLPGWSKWDFFTVARASLGGSTPLEALRAGRVDEVMHLAQAVVEEARG
ncbi:MAG: hypothetical protein Q4B17_12135 [Lautropia sp.]|nr:hypothetical protein [Lautropia sp.]